jgi:hypothetical protein
VSIVLNSDAGTVPQVPLGTFVEFLHAYLKDDVSLYPV